MEQLRTVNTKEGPVSYRLIHKPIRRVNLRIREDDGVVLSAPVGFPAAQADRLVAEKSGWIVSKLRQKRQLPPVSPPLSDISREEEEELLHQAVQAVYPLVQPLGVALPQVRLRRMKSQWGNCHYRQGYMTLNRHLARCPQPLREYVALHELVHFLHPNHGPGFYNLMDRLMPDWQRRRRDLRQYGQLLRQRDESRCSAPPA